MHIGNSYANYALFHTKVVVKNVDLMRQQKFSFQISENSVIRHMKKNCENANFFFFFTEKNSFSLRSKEGNCPFILLLRTSAVMATFSCKQICVAFSQL